jgi:hypothetical protein
MDVKPTPLEAWFLLQGQKQQILPLSPQFVHRDRRRLVLGLYLRVARPAVRPATGPQIRGTGGQKREEVRQ